MVTGTWPDEHTRTHNIVQTPLHNTEPRTVRFGAAAVHNNSAATYQLMPFSAVHALRGRRNTHEDSSAPALTRFSSSPGFVLAPDCEPAAPALRSAERHPATVLPASSVHVDLWKPYLVRPCSDIVMNLYSDCAMSTWSPWHTSPTIRLTSSRLQCSYTTALPWSRARENKRQSAVQGAENFAWSLNEALHEVPQRNNIALNWWLSPFQPQCFARVYCWLYPGLPFPWVLSHTKISTWLDSRKTTISTKDQILNLELVMDKIDVNSPSQLSDF